ncbi:ABC transporter permease, partial [Streptomyces sp. NPDC059618]
MLAYLIRRLFAAVVMLVVIVMVVFGIFFLIPKWAGVDIALSFVGKQADPAAVEGVREKLGLGDPIYAQVWEFFKGIFAGRTYTGGGDSIHCAAPCFGYSFRSEQAVWPVLTDRFPVTLALALGAAVLWLIFGVSAGVLSALKRGSLWDRGAMVIALSGVSLPIYFTGMVALSIFVYGLDLFDGQFVPLDDSFTGWFGGMILPWVTLAFLYAAMYARITRATMLEILGEDYIRTARAKGLKEQTVIGKHAMRSTMTPL